MNDDKISTFLWFDGRASEAVEYWAATFDDLRVGSVSHYGPGMPMPAGSVMTVNFTLYGQRFVALNGGPQYAFTPAVSFLVECADQAEIDRLWNRLADGGEPLQCGWVRDRFGVTWQIVPEILPDLLGSDDEAAAGRAVAAMMTMQKFDIGALQRAYDGAA